MDFDDFKDIAKKAGKSAVDYAKTQHELVEEYRDKYADYSDERLRRIMSHGAYAQKMACMMILNERGGGYCDE